MHPGDAGAAPYVFFAVEDMDAAVARVRRAGRRDRADMDVDGDRGLVAVRPLQVLQGRPGLAVRAAPAAGLMARVVRHESERDRWEMIHGAPDPRLGGYVLDYCAYDERTGSFVRRRELPSDRVVAIVNFGAPIRVLTHGRLDRPAGRLLRRPARHVRDDRDARRPARRADRPHAGRRAPAAAGADARARAGGSCTLDALFGRAGMLLHEALAGAAGGRSGSRCSTTSSSDRLDDALSPVPSA